jgi:hypothetical protein
VEGGLPPQDPEGKTWGTLDRDIFPAVGYEHLEYVGTCARVKPLPPRRDKRYRQVDVLLLTAPHNLSKAVRKMSGEYYRCIPDVVSYYKSIKKMDFPPCREYKQHHYWRVAKDYIRNAWHLPFTHHTRVWEVEEIYEDMDLSKSPGEPWTSNGFRTKKATLESPVYLDYVMTPFWEREHPLWSAVGKVEWLHADDLDDDKCRTFIIPPVHFLADQKRFYGSQNLAFKMHHWSAYGFNPYHGGTNRLAKRLLKHRTFLTYDVKGWDRLLPLLKTGYSIRNSYLSDEHYLHYHYVTKHTCRAYILLANGMIIRRLIGNNSGSNNTTTDNILCHSLILCFALLVLFDGNLDLVDSVIAALFGDDDVCGLPDTDKDIEKVFRECFALFGLQLDPVVVTTNLEECEFLGFYFMRCGTSWIPAYKKEKIAASFAYEYERAPSDAARISKAWTLMVMSASHEDLFDILSQIVRGYLADWMDSDDPTIKCYCDMGVPTRRECLDFFLGLEACYIDQFFDYSCLESLSNMEVGGIKCCSDDYKR